MGKKGPHLVIKVFTKPVFTFVLHLRTCTHSLLSEEGESVQFTITKICHHANVCLSRVLLPPLSITASAPLTWFIQLFCVNVFFLMQKNFNNDLFYMSSVDSDY